MESSKKRLKTVGRKIIRFFLAVAMISLLVALEADSKTKPSKEANHKVETQRGTEDFHDDRMDNNSADESRKRRGIRDSAAGSQMPLDEERKARKKKSYPTTIKLDPPSILTSEETTVTFYCWLNGDTTPKITWEKLDGDLPPNSVVTEGVLEIIKTEQSNSGSYACKATAKGGYKLTAVSTLTIKEGPFFKKIPPSHINVTEDSNSSTLAVCCEADGVPSPEVTWSKLGENCCSGLPQRSLEVRAGCLTIQNMTVEDGGKYMCRASNENGIVQAVTEVNVIGLNDAHGLDRSSILGNLDEKYLEQLLSYLDPILMDSVDSRFVRCYHAMTDGWAASTFHSNCDGKGPTVTIIQVKSYIFGGYTNKAWYSWCAWSAASQAFIYSLYNSRGYSPVKLPQYRNQQYAMNGCSTKGPTFGGNDIFIANNANSNSNSTVSLGGTYQPPLGCSYKNGCSRSFLVGSSYFTPTDLEVFYETI